MFSGAQLHAACTQMGPRRQSTGPPLAGHFTAQTYGRFYGRLGKQGRRPEAATCRRDLSCFSSNACEKTTIPHCIRTPAYLRGEMRLTCGGAYAKLSGATSLIANHRVQTRWLVDFFPVSAPANSKPFLPFFKFFFFLSRESSIKGQKCLRIHA